MSALQPLPFRKASVRWAVLFLVCFGWVLSVTGCGPAQPPEPTATLTPTTPPTATPVPGPQPGHYLSEEKFDDYNNLVLIEFDIVTPGQLENFVGVVRNDSSTCRFETKTIQLDGDDGFDIDLAEYNFDEASALVGHLTGQFTDEETFSGTLRITQCGRLVTMSWFQLEWESQLSAGTD